MTFKKLLARTIVYTFGLGFFLAILYGAYIVMGWIEFIVIAGCIAGFFIFKWGLNNL